MFSAPFAVLWSLAALAQEPVAAGSVFSVKEVSPADGYYPQKASLIGKECTASGQLTVTPGTTWYGGPAVCGPGARRRRGRHRRKPGGRLPHREG